MGEEGAVASVVRLLEDGARSSITLAALKLLLASRAVKKQRNGAVLLTLLI